MDMVCLIKDGVRLASGTGKIGIKRRTKNWSNITFAVKAVLA